MAFYNVQGQEINSASPYGDTNNIAESLNNIPAGTTNPTTVNPAAAAASPLPPAAVVDTSKSVQLSTSGRYAAYGAVAGTIAAMIAGKPVFKWLLVGGGIGLVLGWMLSKGSTTANSMSLGSTVTGLTDEGANALAAEYGTLMGKGVAQTGGDPAKQFTSDISSGLSSIEQQLQSAGYALLQKGNSFIATKTTPTTATS